LRFLRNELLKLAESKPYATAIRLLQSIPGVGLFASLAWVLELPAMKYFLTDDKLANFLGLTPSEVSSGSKRRLGSISKTGNPKIRWLLVQSSWILIKKIRSCNRPSLELNGDVVPNAPLSCSAEALRQDKAVLLHQTPYAIGTIA